MARMVTARAMTCRAQAERPAVTRVLQAIQGQYLHVNPIDAGKQAPPKALLRVALMLDRLGLSAAQIAVELGPGFTGAAVAEYLRTNRPTAL